MIQRFFALGILAASLTTACDRKQESTDGSSAKSLDNLAKGSSDTYVKHECGLAYNGEALSSRFADKARAQVFEQRAAAIETTSPALKNAAVGAMLGTPEKLLTVFFNANGKIRILPSAVTACNSGGLKSLSDDLAGSNAEKNAACWRSEGSPATPVIYIAPVDTATVRYNLPRMFAFVLAEGFIAALDKDNKIPQFSTLKTQEGLTSFKQARADLAAQFMLDMAEISKPAYDRLDTIRKSPANVDIFANAIMAEAIHSQICNDDTRADFQKNYKRTYAVYHDTKNPHSIANQVGQ